MKKQAIFVLLSIGVVILFSFSRGFLVELKEAYEAYGYEPIVTLYQDEVNPEYTLGEKVNDFPFWKSELTNFYWYFTNGQVCELDESSYLNCEFAPGEFTEVLLISMGCTQGDKWSCLTFYSPDEPELCETHIGFEPDDAGAWVFAKCETMIVEIPLLFALDFLPPEFDQA